MNRLMTAYCRLLEALLVLLLALMVLLVFGNVVMRYAFNTGITESEELSRWLFVWLTFLGAIVALRERGHLGTDMLIARLPPAAQRLCLGVSQALMLWVTWLVGQGSWQQAVINWDVPAPVTGLSTAVFYGSGVVFAASTALLLAHALWRTLTGQLDAADLIMVQESEDLAHLGDSGPGKA